MKIYVDADACPVVKIVEQVAKENNIPVTLLCTDRSGSGDPKKRTEADNDAFRSSFKKLITSVRNKGGRGK
jgi:hypothetical protein